MAAGGAVELCGALVVCVEGDRWVVTGALGVLEGIAFLSGNTRIGPPDGPGKMETNNGVAGLEAVAVDTLRVS